LHFAERNVFLEEIEAQLFLFEGDFLFDLEFWSNNHRLLICELLLIPSVTVVLCDSLAHFAVNVFSLFIQNNEEKVESAEERVREADILCWWKVTLVLAVDGVGGGDHTASGIQGAVDACFRDRNSLLLHDFVHCNSVNIVHLVKFVYQQHTSVSQYHSSCFEHILP
jgi:hypothetical protein